MLVWVSVGLAIGAVTGIWLLRRESLRCGEVEGVLLLDGQPAPEGTLVGCHISQPTKAESSPEDNDLGPHYSCIMWDEYARTDSAGRFKFKRIPEGEVDVGRAYGEYRMDSTLFGLIRIKCDELTHMDHEQHIDVRPGENTSIQLGTGGRTVQGRFTVPEAHRANANFCHLSHARLRIELKDPERPDWVTRENHDKWWADFIASDDGRLWRKKIHRSYHVDVDEKWNFTINNVHPGNYILDAYFDHGKENEDQDEKPFGDYHGSVEIADPENGDRFNSLDLGDLPLTLYSRLNVGDPIPDLSTIRTTLGNPIDMNNYRGKILILYLCSQHSCADFEFFQAQKDAAARHRDRGIFAALVLVAEDYRYAAESIMKKVDVRLSVGCVKEEEKLMWFARFGVRKSTCFLVGPDGNIISCNVTVDSLGFSIETALMHVTV